MIKINYRELPTGLHAQTESQGRHTTIYLLPGLTSAQRRAALRRVRQGARMGHGPGLSFPGLVLAVAVDRVAAAARTCVSVIRLHPAASGLPATVFAGLTALYVLTGSVPVHIVRVPQSPGLGGVAGQRQSAVPPNAGGRAPGTPPDAGSPGSAGGAHPADAAGRDAARRASDGTADTSGSAGGTLSAGGVTPSSALTSPSPDPIPPGSAGSVASGGGPSSGDPVPPIGATAVTPALTTGIAVATGAARPPGTTPASGSPAPAAARPAPSSSSGLCLHFGAFGVCLSL